ncbi:MAG: Maff2 family mobile element protein, partial [Christensenellaceae bacterium]
AAARHRARFYSYLGIKQLMAGGGIALVGATLIPLLSGLFG